MAQDMILFAMGAWCGYCFFVYFQNLKDKKQKAKELKETQEQEQPEIGVYYRPKDNPWGNLAIVIDVKDGYVKYRYYSQDLGFYGNSHTKIRSFFSAYKKNEDQNINIESQS